MEQGTPCREDVTPTHAVLTFYNRQLPIFHPALVKDDPEKWARIQQDGFAGFTGNPETQSSPVTSSAGTAYSSLHETGEWGWCTEGGREVGKMVTTLFPVEEFECVWVSNGDQDK